MADKTTLPTNVIPNTVNPSGARYEINMRELAHKMTDIRNQEETVREGGGAKAIDSQHKKNRLTARERLAKLLDPGIEFFELGLYAAHGM